MSENCNHDCGSCSANCASREGAAPDFSAKPNPHSHVKKVIGVVSGKGGVGKSLVTSMMAVLLRRRGQNVAILDADITGPSIPRMFGVHGQLSATDEGIIPAASTTGVKMVSLNLLLERETDPVVWRGPVIAGTVKQFWSDVMWGDVDYMFVDMPPGTGDVPLTVFQSLPVNGILIVTSPQELVGMIVEKAVRMANMMNVPVLGPRRKHVLLPVRRVRKEALHLRPEPPGRRRPAQRHRDVGTAAAESGAVRRVRRRQDRDVRRRLARRHGRSADEALKRRARRHI